MPCAFVELAAAPGDGDGDGAGDEVRGAGEAEGDGFVEAECLDDGGEEVLEAVGGETGESVSRCTYIFLWRVGKGKGVRGNTYCICAMRANTQTIGSLAAC